MAFYLALTHPTSYNPPVAHLLTLQSRVGVADDSRGPTKCMDCLHDGLRNLCKIWDCHLISTLHAIELIFNEYVLTSKAHGQNVFCAFRFGLTVYDKSEILIFHSRNVWYGRVKFYVKNLSSVVKPIAKKSKYMHERYKLLRKTTAAIYLIVIMIISFSSNI